MVIRKIDGENKDDEGKGDRQTETIKIRRKMENECSKANKNGKTKTVKSNAKVRYIQGGQRR